MQVAAERIRTTYTPVQGFDRMGRGHSKHIRLLLLVNALQALSTLDPGGEVQFHARNERMQHEKERRFRLRHQDREYV